MAEEISVILKRNENRSFGFSLLGEPGLPPIIYNILDDFPAAESGVVEVGDVILQINETDVIKFNTKEVLKCLRLSVDPVTLKIKRDPNIRSTILKHLLTSSDVEERDKIEVSCLQSLNILHPEPTIHRVHHIHQNYKSSNGSYTSEQESLLPMEKQQCQSIEDSDCMQWKPLDSNGQPTHVPPKFEAYMMTGQHMLNISRSPQTSTIKPKHQKQVDNLRYHNSHCHHLRHRFQQSIEQISMPNSPNEKELGSYRRAVAKLVTIPTTTPLVQINKKNLPVSDGFNYVRTSRSEDQLQDHNEMCCVSVANAEADEDIASSLNTLLDTRLDSLGCNNEIDRIIWTYNSPFTEHNKFIQTSNGSSSSHSNVSLTSSSSPHSESPASPTSISSSVMSNFSGSRRIPNGPSVNQEFNISEAISNISSPDYHDDDSVGIRDCIMEISDHSDSDSTLLVSEPKQRHIKMYSSLTSVDNDEHRIVIQVRGPDKERSENICDRKSSGCSSTIRNEVTEYQKLFLLK